MSDWQEGPGLSWFEVKDDAGKTFLVPFNRAIFVEIDIPGRKVKLALPEGLRELN